MRLVRSQPSYANGRPGLHRIACRGQLAGTIFDPEHDDVVTPLVCGDQPLAARIEVEVAWGLTAGRSVVHKRQFARLVYREAANAVVPTVGAIQPLSVRMDDDFRGRRILFEIRRQRTNFLPLV